MAKGRLFKSNINHITKVLEQLNYSQRMNGSQVILCERNQHLLLDAKQLLTSAINKLNEIE